MALAEKRPFLLAGIALALAFYYLRVGTFPELYLVPVKGLAVAMLAIYALRRHRSVDARLLAVMLAVAAFGEMAIEVDLSAASLLYFAFATIGLALFLRHRRPDLTGSQKAAAVALLIGTPVIAGLLPGDARAAQAAGLYGLAIGAMAAAAWTSSFPRYRVGAGAVLLVVAQLLLIAQLGPLQGDGVSAIFPWPLSFLGLMLIAAGLTQTLRKRDPELRVVASN